MAYTMHIDPDINCVFFKHYGPISVDEFVKSFSDILEHPDYRAGMNILRDNSDQQFPADISFEAIAASSKRVKEQDSGLGDCKWASVVGDAQSYSKVHQYITSGRLSENPIERRVFREMEKAREWLGIPVDYEIKYPDPEDTT